MTVKHVACGGSHTLVATACNGLYAFGYGKYGQRFGIFLFCFVCFVLFCFVLFCFVLFCFVLFCFVLFCFVLFCFVLFCYHFFKIIFLKNDLFLHSSQYLTPSPSRGDGTYDKKVTKNTLLDFPKRNEEVVGLAAGENFSACVLSNGNLYTFGDNSSGQVGRGGEGKGEGLFLCDF